MAFVMDAGVDRIRPFLEDLLARGVGCWRVRTSVHDRFGRSLVVGHLLEFCLEHFHRRKHSLELLRERIGEQILGDT